MTRFICKGLTTHDSHLLPLDHIKRITNLTMPRYRLSAFLNKKMKLCYDTYNLYTNKLHTPFTAKWGMHRIHAPQKNIDKTKKKFRLYSTAFLAFFISPSFDARQV